MGTGSGTAGCAVRASNAGFQLSIYPVPEAQLTVAAEGVSFAPPSLFLMVASLPGLTDLLRAKGVSTRVSFQRPFHPGGICGNIQPE